MIISMPTAARSQQPYGHRLRNLVERTGDVAVATDLGVPRSTAHAWLGETPTVVVCLDVTELTEPELRLELFKLRLRRRVRKLTGAAPARAGPAANARVSPHRSASAGRTREHLPLRALLRFLRVAPSRYHAWGPRQRPCVLDRSVFFYGYPRLD